MPRAAAVSTPAPQTPPSIAMRASRTIGDGRVLLVRSERQRVLAPTLACVWDPAVRARFPAVMNGLAALPEPSPYIDW